MGKIIRATKKLGRGSKVLTGVTKNSEAKKLKGVSIGKSFESSRVSIRVKIPAPLTPPVEDGTLEDRKISLKYATILAKLTKALICVLRK